MDSIVLCAVLFLSVVRPLSDLVGQTESVTSLTLILDCFQDFRERAINIGVYFPKRDETNNLHPL